MGHPRTIRGYGRLCKKIQRIYPLLCFCRTVLKLRILHYVGHRDGPSIFLLDGERAQLSAA